MNGGSDFDSEFVEVDPTGRYYRCNEILGKGSSKTVYRAFDEYEGIEVAWNQVRLCDFLQNPEDLERLYREIHLLKTLKHENIMKFYTSWVDIANRKINFVTEMFTSGTLRQYRLKHRRTNIRAIKNWCRQILQGLLYLHSQDPPIIHRDLKCDNIFINGNQGEVKIGDLGLAAILRKSHAARCVGTPEFMAPEVYEEEYNELVDIYSFGMCILEMVTFEYPYSECTHPAQIYKKVISGQKPDALYKIKDPEIRRFLGKCLGAVSERYTAWELLNDPFLQIEDQCYDLRSENRGSYEPQLSYSNLVCYGQEPEHEPESEPIDLFVNHEDDHHLANVDITVKGKRKEDGSIFLRIRIADQEGCVRNIHFRFDIETDTALSVSTEMIVELDITDQDVTGIARLIDDEISTLVPGWERGFQERPGFNNTKSNSRVHYSSTHQNADEGSSAHRRQGSTIHGRFEEFTYMFDEANAGSSLSDETDTMTQHYPLDDQQLSCSPKSDTKMIDGLLSLQDLFSADKKDDPRHEGKFLVSDSNRRNEGSKPAASLAKGKVFPMFIPKGKGSSNLEVYS